MIPRNTAAVTKMGIKSEIYLITNDGEQTSDKKDAMLHLFCGQTKLKRKQNFFLIKSNIYCFSFSLIVFFTIICLTLRFLWLVFNLFSNDSISSEQKKKDWNDIVNAPLMWFLLLYSKLWKSFPTFKCQREN